jgi:hypothetical protein
LVQWRNEDPSGNRSEYTQQYLLELDQTKPQFFNVTSASSNKFNPIIDWKQNGQTTFYRDGRENLPPITNQLDLTLNGTTEQLADVEYFLIDNQGQLANSQTLINNKDQKHNITFNLGDKTADKDGQPGLNQDGYYQICYNSADSSDNEIGVNCFVIQRDTLSPVAPNFSANLNFVYKNTPYTIQGAVAGEPYTNSSLFGNLGSSGQRGGTLKTLDPNNDSDWETTFTFCTNLTDRATNQSPTTCRSVTTPVRPPRDGECSLNDNQKSTIEDHIKNLTDPNTPLPDLGFSKSCQTYEPELIQTQVNAELQAQSEAKNQASSCVQQNEWNRARKETDFVGPLAANKKCDTSLLTTQEITNIKDSYQKSIDNYKQSKADYEELKAKILEEQRQAEIEAEQQANACDWNWNVFDGNNCVNKKATSFKDGFVSGIMAIPDSIPGILDRLGDIPNHLLGKDTKYSLEDILINGVAGAVAIVATTVALVVSVVAVVAAPFTAGASLGLLSISATALTIAGYAGLVTLGGNMLLDNSDKPKFISPFESKNPIEYVFKIGDNAKTKLGSMACGEGGQITNIDEDQIGDFEITDPEYCAGRVTSLAIQAVLLGGLKKNIDKKLGVAKKPIIIDVDCVSTGNTNTLLAFFTGVKVEAGCVGGIPKFDNLVDYGKWVSKNLNKNSARVKIKGDSKTVNGSVVEELDLTGARHFEKTTGKYIETPHVKVTISTENINPVTGEKFLNTTSYVRPATRSDIDAAVNILNK